MCKKGFIILLIFILTQIICINSYGAETGEINNPLILMYHRISDEYKSDAFTITPELFENDIKELASLGYKFCTADEYDRAINEYRTDKIVAITFDDGYKSDIEYAVPILKKYNACATFFIIGSKIGTDEYVTEEDVKMMAESGVAQIGNHSFDYHQKSYEEVKKIYSENPDYILEDIKKNQEYLQMLTGREITAYSYPYGVYGNYIDSQLKNMGMVTFCSDETVAANPEMIYGRFNRPYDIPLDIMLKRVNTNNRSFVKLKLIQLANKMATETNNN